MRRGLLLVAVLAFVAMFVQDTLGTLMVIFESHYSPFFAGACDVGEWIAGLICAGLALNEIIKNGWRTRKSLTIIGAVSAANFVGTFVAVTIALHVAKAH